MLYYKNVVFYKNNNVFKNEFYFYEIDTENGYSFNEYTILNDNEQKKFYFLLMEMAKNLNWNDRLYIKNVIKKNKNYIKKYKQNKYEQINRDKKVQIFYRSKNN